MHVKFSTCGEIKEGFEKASPTFKTPSQGTGLEPASDNARGVGDTKTMNDITREEFNAKLETIEVKMDARVESVSAKIDGFLSAQSERDKRLDAALAQISANHAETKSSLSSMKVTMIVTAVSTVLAIVFGISSFNTALTSNMMAAFQVGLSKSEQPKIIESAPLSSPPPASPKPSSKQ